VPRLAEVRSDGWRGIDFFAQWEGRERLPVECAHQWAKTEPTDDGRAGERCEPVREWINERGRRNGAEDEHPGRRCVGESVAVEDAAA